ncbi:MAG: serine/threonine protein kinase [Lachnospiraceae bacterium]|nr:serine/threonine protein kinase [Lachnospiraceae bacterium]
MEGMLKTGSRITSESGNSYTVNKMLGSGGQGEVYEVTGNNGKKALKWYYKSTSSKEQKSIIMDLVQDGAPSKNFLWPEDFITDMTNGTFGYIMDLRPGEYKNIPDLLNRKTDPSFEILIKSIFNMAKEYEALHSKGYSYKDISDQNVFFNPKNGSVLICDNDNVSINGMQDSGVYGTMRFMAPEIVRGEATPSRNTDLYSLAVLIFNMLFISHPLEGTNEYKIHALDDNANKALFGTHPVFIYDPNNPENRPVQGFHDNAIIYWSLYPEFLKQKFIKAFTDGIRNPAARVVEHEWKEVSIKLLDSLMICPSCGAEVFYDEAKETTGENHVCWNCKSVLRVPPKMKLGKHTILLDVGRKLKSHHLNNDYDMDTDVAEVNQNPNNPGQLGLKNMTTDTWVYIRPDGTQSMLPPGRSAALAPGVTIDFGKNKGQM